uniref:Cullin domain-containing protein n=1 Tax=Angiostrongylus cantonensis TaxID=6313 RepID=A0A158P8R0_ANGCA
MELELAARWNDLTSFLSEKTREKWYKMIIDAYTPRPFRGIAHLCAMFSLFDKYKDHLKDRYATAFAIFFKNLVYDPLASDNAEKSAQLLHQFAQETTLDSVFLLFLSTVKELRMLFEFENYVADLITASGSYSTEAHLSEGVCGAEDVHYLIDFDMAFLGDDEEQFVNHEKAQRKEYDHMRDDEYRNQRAKVLRFFLQIPNIYATKELRADLELKARENIAREIDLLEGKIRTY